MKELNIYKDGRDRGLEVLLYNNKEEASYINQEEPKKFKLKIRIPLPFNREFTFQFETYIIKKHKLSGKN